MHVCKCVCAGVLVRACVQMCVRVFVCVWVTQLNRVQLAIQAHTLYSTALAYLMAP